MALTQSALRPPGPSWDEEVVPALRKRLQSESRTLSKRMSAISLSGDEVVGVGGTFTPYTGNDATIRQKPSTQTATTAQGKHQHRQPSGSNSVDYSNSFRSKSGSSNGSGATTTTSHPNAGAQASSTTTISTSPESHHTNGSASTSSSFQRSRTYSQPDSAAKMNTVRSTSNSGARPSDPKPTRIPKPAARRDANYSSSNGNGNGTTPVAPQYNTFPGSSSPPQHHLHQSEFGGVDEGYYDGRGEAVSSYLTTSSTSRSIQGLAEGRSVTGLLNESPPFPPSSSATSLAQHTPSMNGHHDPGVNHDYIPGVGDISTTTPPVHASASATSNSNITVEDLEATTPRPDDRSTTPTPMSHSQRAGSGQYPPSRIPAPSQSRRSTDTRSGTPSTLNTSTRSMNASTSSTSTKTPSPPLVTPATSGTRSVSGQSLTASQSGSAGRKGPSPVSPQKRRAPTKSLRGKQTPIVLPKRQSVGQYPLAPGDGEDMADAIPSWTQPIPKTGNWDEVVLPVVARNKGLEGQFQTAHGRPQSRRLDDPIAPAPGTFGYDHSKIRSTRNGDEFIPLDEFGRPEQPIDEEQGARSPPQNEGQHPERPQEAEWASQDQYHSKHDQTRLPTHGPSPPSPPPFAHYANGKETVAIPPSIQESKRRAEGRLRDEDNAGCCKCAIM